MAISRDRDQKTTPKTQSKFNQLQARRDVPVALTWGNISPFKLKLLITALAECGDAVTFGTTRQGGLSLTILEGDERYKEYSNDVDHMEALMASYTDAALASLPQQVRDRTIELCRDL